MQRLPLIPWSIVHSYRTWPRCLPCHHCPLGRWCWGVLTDPDKLYHHHRGQAGIQLRSASVIKSLLFYELDGCFGVSNSLFSVCNMGQYIWLPRTKNEFGISWIPTFKLGNFGFTNPAELLWCLSCSSCWYFSHYCSCILRITSYRCHGANIKRLIDLGYHWLHVIWRGSKC